MARDDDWLLQEIARSQSPFQSFERPDSPFGTPDPGPDETFTTRDIKAVQKAREPNAFQKVMRWLSGALPEPQRAGDQIIGGGEASSHASALPRAAMNMAWSDIPRAALHSADKYAGGFGAAMEGRSVGEGLAGTGVDETSMVVPPQTLAMFAPGLGRMIAKGEASPFSTYDAIRARWDNTPPVPFFGKETFPAVWAEEVTAGRQGSAYPHHANPFSPGHRELQKTAEAHNMSLQWPRPPKWEGEATPSSVGNMKRLPGHAANDADFGLVKFNAETGNRVPGAIVGKRSEPLPMTAAVAEWLKMSGKEPSLRLARGSNETDYVSLPHGPQERQRGLARTKVRVPDDGHPGWPEPGLIDTAPTKAGRTDPDVFSRVNAAGQPFSKPDALIDALKWATSSSPEGNWLVPPGAEPRWARYAKEEKPPSPFTGTEPPSPAQPRLSESVGELWAKSGDRFTAAVAAMKLDPEKAKAVGKALENMRGLDDSAVAGVLKKSYDIDPSVSMPALMSNPKVTRRDAGTATYRREAREKAAQTEHFWRVWDKHAGRQVDIAKELGVTQATVSRWANPGTPQHRPRPTPQSAEAAAAEAGRRNLYPGSKAEYDAQRYQSRKEEMARQYQSRRGEPSPNWGGYREGAGRPPMPSVATKPGTATPVGPLVEGVVEKAAQNMRTAPEMSRRPEGVRKTLWDEHGKAAQQAADLEYVQGLAKRLKDQGEGGDGGTTLYAGHRRGGVHAFNFTQKRLEEAHRLHDEGKSPKEIEAALNAMEGEKAIMSRIMGREDTIVPSQLKRLMKYLDERREARKMRGK